MWIEPRSRRCGGLRWFEVSWQQKDQRLPVSFFSAPAVSVCPCRVVSFLVSTPLPAVCVCVCVLPSRMYHAEKLPETNLVFIISDARLTCPSCDSKPLIQDEQQCILSPSGPIGLTDAKSNELKAGKPALNATRTSIRSLAKFWISLSASVRQMGHEASLSASLQTNS